jgi:nucleoside-diphosphate-sugar epimerase
MKDVFDTIVSVMGSDAKVVTDEARIRPGKSEVFRLWCDNSKIMELTDFRPQYNLEAGLRETIEWFQNPENLKKYKANIYNI